MRRGWLIVGLLLVPAWVFSLVWHVGLLRANHHLNSAERRAAVLDYQRAFEGYERSLRRGGHALNPYTRYRYGLKARQYVRNSEYFEREVDYGFLRRAVELQEENMEKEWPAFTRNHVVKGQLAGLLTKEDEEYRETALESLERALEMSPGRPSLYLDMAEVWSGTDPARAEDLIERSLEMNNLNAQAHWRLALLRIRQGRVEEAQALYPRLSELGFPLFNFRNMVELVLTLEEAGYGERAEHFRSMVRSTYLTVD